MKPMAKFSWYIFLSVLISSFTYSQVFNLEDYIQFRASHQNMSTEELLQMHPAGTFVDKINLNPESVLYFDSISAKYDLTEYEKSLIADHGFMVTERLSEGSLERYCLIFTIMIFPFLFQQMRYCTLSTLHMIAYCVMLNLVS